MTEMKDAPTALANFLSCIERDTQVLADFQALCDCGGRLAGSCGEEQAIQVLISTLSRIGRGKLEIKRNKHVLWETDEFSLTHIESGTELAATPLLGTAPTPADGIVREIVDVGLGRPKDFDRLRHLLPGRIALVRHEYPFMSDHVHRNTKSDMAEKAGACGFLIAFQESGVGPISGSSSGKASEGIPSFGISAEAAALLAQSETGFASVRMLCLGRSVERNLPTVILTLAGESEEMVVVSAHIDGHPLGESAIDNASGLAGIVALARAVASDDIRLRRTVRFCAFSAEEWDLGGSIRWLDSLSQRELDNIVLNINLDAIAGDPVLTALTSDFEILPAFLTEAANYADKDLQIFEPTKSNSDHVNFAERGIPAFRLLAGFERPSSALRFLLTGKDRRDLVTAKELNDAATIAGAVLFRAANASREEMAKLKARRRGD
ncbi:M28 family peptidase [Rhizobium sp. BR 314]|uniref:M28 family peptidase n=1 Tax=Rhizobium sp. BR 314 TaxID=3040013 RepID=UPI0039BF639A